MKSADPLRELTEADRKTLRELERENTPDLDALLEENGYQYPKEQKNPRP